MVETHSKSSVFGDPEDCWIKYDGESNTALENAYWKYASGLVDKRYCHLGKNWYMVDFLMMIQTNSTTNFRRKVQRHVMFQHLVELHYNDRQDRHQEALQCCDLLNQTMTRIENEVKESIDRDIHFGLSHKDPSRTVKYFRQNQVQSFLDVIVSCQIAIKLCCERAGEESSENPASQPGGFQPDSRSAAECCLGEDAREMGIHFIDFVKERLSRYHIQDVKLTTAAEKLVVWLNRLQTLNYRRLIAIGVSRGDPSRPLRFHNWSEEYIMNDLVAKTSEAIHSTKAFSFRPESKAFLHTLHKYLECREKMDARYLEVDEFQLIASQSLSTASGGMFLSLDSNGDSIGVKPEYQQQSISGSPVATMDELFEAATCAQPCFQELIENTISQLDGKMSSTKSRELPIVSFAQLKDRIRAHEKAQDDYMKFVPSPAYSWLYDIVRGSIEFHSAAEVITFVYLLEQDPSIHIVKAKNRFENPSLTGYRDLNIQFQISVNGRFKHICEIQIHHHAIKVLDKELNTHQYYEYFRSYFAGATRSLKDRLEDLQLIGGSNTVDEDYLASLLPSCTDEERLERLGALFEVQLTEYHWSLQAYVNLLNLQTSRYGQHHPSIAKTYANIGNVMKARGKLGDSMLCYKASLRSDQSSSMVLASAYQGMAALLALQNQTEDALELFESAVKIIGTARLIVGAYIDMANLLRDGGEVDRAMDLYERAMSITTDQYGEEHEDCAIVLRNMARILSRKGEFDNAIRLSEKSLEITKKTLGEDHLSTAEIYQSMGLALQQQGNLTEATRLYENARKMYQRRRNEYPTLVADLYDMLASVSWQECKFSDAKLLHGRARRIRDTLKQREDGLPITFEEDLSLDVTIKLVGEDHPYLAYALDCRARSFLHSQSPEKALPLFKKSAEIIKKKFGYRHILLANVHQEQATLLRCLGMLDEAMEALGIFRSIVDELVEKGVDIENCAEYARAYEDIASLLQEQSEMSSALRAIMIALDLRKQVALKSDQDMLLFTFTFKRIAKMLDDAKEENDQGPLVTQDNIKRRILIFGLELYQEMLRTNAHRFSWRRNMLLDALEPVEEQHSGVGDLRIRLVEGNREELLVLVTEILDDLRSASEER